MDLPNFRMIRRSSYVLPLIFLTIIALTGPLLGQENGAAKIDRYTHTHGHDLFDNTLYNASSITFQKAIAEPHLPNFGNYEKLRREAILTTQIADLRLEEPAALSQLTYYVNEFYPDPITSQAIMELGSHCYYAGNFQQAINWYDKLNVDQLSEIDRSEALFKKGYAYFVRKEFKSAETAFKSIKDTKNVFFYPVNYYYGMCQYFLNNYAGAISSFKQVSNSEYYGNYIPYYISQIYFSQSQYDLLISYAEQKITEPSVNNKKDIRLLLGQAYYQRGDFERAIKHLEFYEANTEKLTAEEFYQIAFTQYKLGKYDKAKPNFEQLAYLDNKMGQLSSYYLADCEIKAKNKIGARAAFKRVSQMTFDPGMKEEATFNFAKLSAELGYEREAINVFVGIPANSPFYNESQDVIDDILINSGDYANSVAIMDEIPNLSAKLQLTYQNLSLKRAIQLYDEGNPVEAKKYFDKSLKYKKDKLYEAQTLYWLAKMDYDASAFENTISNVEKYHAVANGINDIPEEAAPYMANYLKAYAHLKLKEFAKAEIAFKNAVVAMNNGREGITSEYVLNRVLPDALIRVGDCSFKQGKYNEAKTFYNQSITREQAGFVYALYQRGLIEGLLNEPYEKIVSMEEITKKHPKSDYADDAYLQIGETYMGLNSLDPAAIAFIDLMAKHGPSSPYYNNAQIKLGLINYNRGNTEKALEYYKNVFNFNPTPKQSLEAMKSIEEIYVRDLANPEGYFKYLDSIPGLQITDFSKDSLMYFTAYNLYTTGENVKATDAFDNYINRFNQGFYRINARFFRGELYSQAKSYNKALKDYEYVIGESGEPHLKTALWKAAVIAYNDSREFEKALRYYIKYEELMATDVEKYQAQLGSLRSAFKSGNSAKVQEYAIKVSGNAAATKEEKATAQYYQGKVYFNAGNYGPALKAFEEVAKLSNNNQAAEAKYLISEIYYKQEDYAKAEKQCNYNNENSTNYPYWVAKSILLLSDIYSRKGDLINARAAIEAVIENFQNDEDLTKMAKEKMAALENKESKNSRIKITKPGELELDSTGRKTNKNN